MKISRSTLAYPPGRPEASLKTIAITCSTGAVSILNNPWFGLSIDVSLHSAAGSNICIFCVLSRGGELCSFSLPCEDEDERRRRQQELAGDEELSSLPGVVTTNHQDRGNKFLWEECQTQTMFNHFFSSHWLRHRLTRNCVKRLCLDESLDGE